MVRTGTHRSSFCLVAAGAAALAAGAARAQDAAVPAAQEPEKPKSALESAADAVTAEDAERPFVMPEEILVSAERGVPLRYAGGRTTLERDTIDRYPDANVQTLLRRVPGVSVLPENGNDGKPNIGIRGNSPRRSGLVSLLVDGVPAAEAPYGSPDVDFLPVSMERVARIDVIRSGASLRYGPNSAGGVINFVTEAIPETQQVKFTSRYGSDDDYAVGASAGGTWDRFGTLFSYVRRGGDGFRDNSEYTIDDSSAKFRYALTDIDTIQWSVSRYLELDAEMPGGLTPEAYEEDPWQSQREGQDFRGDINTYSVAYTHQFGPTTMFQLLGWYHEGVRELYGRRPNPPPFTQITAQHSEFEAGAIEARFEWETEILGATNRFFHSARYHREENYLWYYRRPFPSGPIVTPYVLNADFEADSFALFTEDVISLHETVDLSVGGRVDFTSMGSDSRDTPTERDDDYHELLPISSLTWTPLPRTALFVSYQENFAMPQYETGWDPTSEYYNNVDPETSKSWEYGTRIREIEGIEATVNVFDVEYKDKIEFVNMPNGQKLTYNSAETDSNGIEYGLSIDVGHFVEELRGLSLFGTLTKQKSIIGPSATGENEGNDSPEAPRTLGSWGVEYVHAETGLWGRIGGSYQGKSYHEPENYEETDASGQQGPIPSFKLWDAAIGWRQCPDGSGLAVSVGMTNLFDEEYFRRFGGGIEPGAPRQSFVAASYTIRW
jgi:Fe(3+) dicitrate transport protein